MGWTYSNNRVDINAAKRQHEREAVGYTGIKAELLASEWHAKTFFAIVRLTFPADHERHPGEVKTFLRIDLIDTAGGTFGYKDGSEEMGMYQDNKPSRDMAAKIYKYIPSAEGYGIEWRARNGVKHDDVKQGVLV